MGPVQNLHPPRPAGKGLPRGMVLRAIGPKGCKVIFLWIGMVPVHESASADVRRRGKAREMCLRAIGPKGPNYDLSGIGMGPIGPDTCTLVIKKGPD